MQQGTGSSNSRASIAVAVFLFVAYLFPYHVAPVPAFYNDGFAILGVLAAGAFWATSSDRAFRLPWIMWVLFALALAVVTQIVFGIVNHVGDVAVPVAYLVLAGLVIGLGATLAAGQFGSDRICLAFAVAILFAALISVAIASLQLARAEIPFYPFVMLMQRGLASIRPHANIGQPNILALLFCWAIAAIWWLYQTRRATKSVSIAAVVVLLWGVALTQSRIVWIILPLFALMCWQWNRRQNFAIISGWFTLGCLLLYAAIAGFALPLISDIYGTSVDTMEGRFAAGGSGRIVLFQQALHMSWEKPWFGIGWNQFGSQQLLIAPDFPATVYSRHSHNILLNFAAELGWPLTVIAFGIFGYWFLKSCISPRQNSPVAFASLVFIAVIVHSMLEYPLWHASILLPICLLIGMVHFERFGAPKVEVPRVGVASVLIFSLVATVAVSDDYRRVVNGFWTQSMVATGFDMDRSAQEKPYFTAFPEMYDFFRYMNIDLDHVKSEEDLKFMEMVAVRFGGPEVWMRLSQAYAAHGRGHDAVRAMNTVYKLHSYKYPFYFEKWKQAPAEYQPIFERLPKPN